MLVTRPYLLAIDLEPQVHGCYNVGCSDGVRDDVVDGDGSTGEVNRDGTVVSAARMIRGAVPGPVNRLRGVRVDAAIGASRILRPGLRGCVGDRSGRVRVVDHNGHRGYSLCKKGAEQELEPDTTWNDEHGLESTSVGIDLQGSL